MEQDFWPAVGWVVILAVLAYNFPVFAFFILVITATGYWYFKYQRPREKDRDLFKRAYRDSKALYDEALAVTCRPTIQLNFNPATPEWLKRELTKIATSLHELEFLRTIPPPPKPIYGAERYNNVTGEWRRQVTRRIELNKTDGRTRLIKMIEGVADRIASVLPSSTPSTFRTTLSALNPRFELDWDEIMGMWHASDFCKEYLLDFYAKRSPDDRTRYSPTPFNDIYSQIKKQTYAFGIPPQTRFAGTWIVAPPGRGKTNLLHNMIERDLKERCTIVLMDSKGDLINGYKGFSDVIVIDPATANINPLQLGSSTRSVEFLEYIFGALLETSMTPLQKTLFRSVLTVLIKVPNATLETFRQILTIGWKSLNIEEYILQCDPSTQDFFLTGKPPEFDNATYRETKQQILWRLRLILSNDYLRNIFTSPTTNIQFSELLDSGATILIDNSKDDLGEEGAEFFGRFFVALTWMAAVTRSRLRPEQKTPVYFYIDECQSVIKRDEKIATILDECRSQKIALILAHQRVAQIVTPNVLDALGNCAIRIANSDEDAPSLASRFRVEPEGLRLPVGSFACFVRDKTPQAVTISVPEFDLSTLPPPPPRTHYTPSPPPRPKPRDEAPAQPASGAAPNEPLDFG